MKTKYNTPKNAHDKEQSKLEIKTEIQILEQQRMTYYNDMNNKISRYKERVISAVKDYKKNIEYIDSRLNYLRKKK